MPITLNGDTGITTPTYGGADTSEYLVPVTQFKNRIINGAMVIDQRNAGAAVTVNNSSNFYCVDRFFGTGQPTDGVFTLQQSAIAPSGFVNSLLATITTADTSLGATQQYLIGQAIEGLNVTDLNWGTASAQTVTLSFWVRSSLTGTFGGALGNSAFNRSYPFTYTISSANTWEQKSITIAGDTTGTWLTTNGVGVRVYWSLGAGSTNSGTAGAWAGTFLSSATGATSVVGTNGATFYITGVQLEVGSTATSFDYRPYGTELALCQRYYELTAGANRAYVTDNLGAYCAFKQNKRASPTLTYIANGTVGGVISSFQSFITGASGSELVGCYPQWNISGAGMAFVYGFTVTASAEL